MIRKTNIGRCGSCIRYEEFNMKGTLYSNNVWRAPNSSILIRQIFLVETGGKFLVRIFTENERKKDVKHFAISKICASRHSEGSNRVLLL